MRFKDRVEILIEAWNDASKTTFDYLTSEQKSEVWRVLDILVTIYNEVE